MFGSNDGYKPPHQFTLFASALFAFSGLFNVILYFSTRKEYAVGPSVTATATILPLTSQDSYLPQAGHILNSREDIEDALNERYGQQPPLTYRNSPSPVPLAQVHGPAHRQLTSGSQLDDDENDYGRLPA